jgi:hypothetical protein
MPTNAQPYNGTLSQPRIDPIPQQGYACRTQNYRAVITLASQPAADFIRLFRLPAGVYPLRGYLCSSVSLGTSTVAIGTAASTGKYRAAATFTAVDTPTPFMVSASNITSGLPVALTAAEEVIATVAVAALPASGTLLIDMEVAVP